MKKWMISIIVSVLAIMALPQEIYADEQADFDAFMEEEFKASMEADYTNLHFTLKDYQSRGIQKPEITMGDFSWDSYEEGVVDAEETLSNLESFSYDALTAEQKHDYDAYHFYLERMIELNQYPEYDFLFYPNGGIQQNIITILTEFLFYSEEDVEDYLTLLTTIPSAFEDAIIFSERQIKDGFFMNDSAIDLSVEGIDKFTEKKEDSALIVIFEQNVDAATFLSDTQKEEYKKRNKELVLGTIIPSYENLSTQLTKWKGSRKYGPAVSDLPEGKTYYSEFMKFKGSTEASLEEMVETCEEAIDLELKALFQNLQGISSNPSQIDLSTPEEMIEYHRAHLEDFPQGPSVSYSANYLDKSVATPGIIAYYLQPPIDDIQNNVMKINGDAVADHNSLFETLAHEGFPGHLYQKTWYLDKQPNALRTNLNFIGYSEGWAMYAENIMTKKMPISKEEAAYYAHNTSLGYILQAAVDIGINGLGWDVEKVSKYLEEVGFDPSFAQDIYDSCVDEPGVIVPYGYGLAKFLRLRDKAETALGSAFDLKAFNEIILTHGDRNFEQVELDVNAYLSENPNSSEVISSETSVMQDRAGRSWTFYLPFVAALVLLMVLAFVFVRKKNQEI